jgi:exosortase/archaeosortase family protein
MTRAVAFAAVEIAGWIGVGAYQIGNIIELHNGFVGVDEACSGVKTLQASIMVSLVLGELFQLGASKRFGLLIGGAIWVFVCNVLRATALVIIAAKQGTVALESWHDGIGTAVVIVGMAGLMAIAWFLRDEESGSDSQPPSLSTRDRGAQAPPTLRFSFFALAWLLAIFVATELWYRSHEHELVALPAWQARWPSEQPTFRDMPIADTTRSILRYDEATSAAWEDPRAIRWWTFFARWEPQRTALQLVRSHSPEICLPAIGRTFVQERPAIVVETDALPLRFRVYEFEQSDRPLFVFVCIQEDKIAAPSRAAAVSEWSAEGRVIAAWRGQRNLGQRLLEIAVIGFDDYLRAREAFAATVRGVVEKSAPTG